MSSLKIVIQVTPQGKGSVRVGKFGTYNPMAKGMNAMKYYVKEKIQKFLNRSEFLLHGPLLVIAHIRLPLPSTYSRKHKEHCNLFAHVRKPDGDNLEKFVNDALNKVIWKDDARIVWMLRSKTYTSADRGSVILFCREISAERPDYAAILKDIHENIEIDDNVETSVVLDNLDVQHKVDGRRKKVKEEL